MAKMKGPRGPKYKISLPKQKPARAGHGPKSGNRNYGPKQNPGRKKGR